MIKSTRTLNAISKIICQSTKDILGSVTGKTVTYAKTIQKVPVIHLRPDIGCFVLFNGDYSGLMITNFTAEAAMCVYRNQMIKMGLPENELAVEHTADDVVDSIGELSNQIIGNVRSEIEAQYELIATNTQPKAIALNTSIMLTIDSPEVEKDLCRKISFKIDGHPFHVEISMEKTEFILLEGGDVHDESRKKPRSHNINMDDYKDQPEEAPSKVSNQNFDFDALMNANKP